MPKTKKIVKKNIKIVRKSFKATKEEVLNRYVEIEKLMIDEGKTYNDLVEYCRKNWGIRHAMTSRYIAGVRKKWEEHIESDRQKNFDEAIKRREGLRKKAIEKEDMRLALEIEKDISKIQGLYIDHVEHKAEITAKKEVSIREYEQLKNLLPKEKREELEAIQKLLAEKEKDFKERLNEE